MIELTFIKSRDGLCTNFVISDFVALVNKSYATFFLSLPENHPQGGAEGSVALPFAKDTVSHLNGSRGQ